MTTFDTALVDVVGSTGRAIENSLGLRTVGDLLRHYPRRLAELGELSDISALREGDYVTVIAEVRTSTILKNKTTPGQRLEATISDGRGTLRLTFFAKKPGALYSFHSRLKMGQRGMFAGTVNRFNRNLQLVFPTFVMFDEENAEDFATGLVPVYPAARGIQSWNIAKSVRVVLDQIDRIPDPLPPEVRARHNLPDRDGALRRTHRPTSKSEWYAARKRLAWDEAMGIQLTLALRRAAVARDPGTARPPQDGGLSATFDQRLPFTLTDGQREIGDLLSAELSDPRPMQRLLQGEVGSGKTIVALRAILQVIDAGGQAALLAPTEVLAAQHARSIEAMLGELGQAGRLGGSELGTRLALLTGSLSAAARRQALLDAASGAAGIVVGTHALIQQHVQFADLGLVVVDEQHRFGVEQRDALRGKSTRPPHLLVMTATPIPRTVAMTVFGDLDTSTLTELPQGRRPITTNVVPLADRPAWIERVWSRVREEVAAGHQAFVVCPRIGDGIADDEPSGDEPADDGGTDAESADDQPRPSAAVSDVAVRLAEGPLAGLRLRPLHGRQSSDEKDGVMSAFAAGTLDVLVATTVVEVGVDVPNATVMVVLDADRFGISQLHQLRGRIGRGSAAGLCLLVTGAAPGSPALARLEAVAATTDGFELARLDVEQRREGDVLGVAQSGRRSGLKLLSLLKDEDLISAARAEATELVAADPLLQQHPLLAAEVAALVEDERAEFLDKT